MKKITVDASVTYDILIEKGILDRVGTFSLSAVGKGKAAVVSDDTVYALYGDRVNASLAEAGYTLLPPFVIPHGEESKNLDRFTSLIHHLAENEFTRTDVIFALGGGVVGELAGFAAACFLRGVRFVQIPTTLLACVDSSVGGKTAVDIPMGKNLVGAFHQPSLVLCDPLVLDTLSPEIFACGMAEVIKYSMLGDKALFDLLTPPCDPKEIIETVIEMCVTDKANIVKEDEFDTGKRQLLNLGHTFGHGVEALADFTVMHGEGVAVGMAIVTRAAVELGLCSKNDCDALLAMLKYYGLPTETKETSEDIFRKSLSDKKRKGGTINLVMPYGIGDSRLYPCAVEDVLSVIQAGRKE